MLHCFGLNLTKVGFFHFYILITAFPSLHLLGFLFCPLLVYFILQVEKLDPP